MKLDRLHEYILPTVVTLGGMGFAAYCGHLTGNGQTSTLATILVAVVLLTTFLTFRERIWVLVPTTFALTGQMPILPLPFAVHDITIFAVFIGFLVLKALKIVKLKPRLEAVDWWLIAVLLYLITAYIRNPVGVDALGSERVGGRPYFNVFVAGMAYWILSRALLSPRHALFLLGLICFGRMSEGILDFVVYRIPALAPVLSEFYSTVTQQGDSAQDAARLSADEGTGRQVFLALIGNPLILVLWSLYRPLTVINPLYIGRFAIFIFAMWCVFASGFRSSFAAAVATMYFAAYFRRGAQDVMRLSMLAVPILMLVIAGQGTLFELPRSAQRAMSFLPGQWDPVSVAEAKGSTEWRTMMWKAMLTEDKYIHNKWLGDGFGFSQRDLAVMLANQVSGAPEDAQENLLIVGGIHSGPISTVRYVGVVGLALFIGLLIVMARTAWRLIRRAEGTEYYPLALFIGLPLIWEPVNYIFIFGGYDSALPTAVFGVGMLKMLTHSLDAYAAQSAAKTAKTADTPAPRRAPEWQRPPLPAGAHLSSR